MADYRPIVLRDPSSSLSATYVPDAGMICTSLAENGVEFLGQRRGLQAYITAGKTMGIPLLYPWANRLSATTYGINGATVTLTPDVAGVRLDEHGLPIHGVLAADPGWLVVEQTANTLVAALDWGGTPRLLSTFPFPHVLTMSATLDDRTLTVDTTVRPSTAAPVPLCYGYHPYLQIPGVAREEWRLHTPAMRHLRVDDRGIPTGETAEWAGGTETLKDTVLDHGFDRVEEGARFAVSGGDHQIEIGFTNGYGAAQIFAPGNDELIAIEPMAAPTDALTRGDYPIAVPGRPETATFSIRIG
ncbi:aldose 1-epimerase [Mycobacterium sp. NPDC003449]